MFSLWFFLLICSNLPFKWLIVIIFEYFFLPAALDAGKALILGGAAVGLGGLCLYGIYGAGAGSSSLSALDKASVWPDYVRDRIHSTYAYLAGGAAIAAASATTLVRSPGFINAVATGGIAAPLLMLVASIGAGVLCQVCWIYQLILCRPVSPVLMISFWVFLDAALSSWWE